MQNLYRASKVLLQLLCSHTLISMISTQLLPTVAEAADDDRQGIISYDQSIILGSALAQHFRKTDQMGLPFFT